jgi:hypothetical protein
LQFDPNDSRLGVQGHQKGNHMSKAKPATMDSVTLAHHLRVAATLYERDVEAMKNDHPEHLARMIKQFDEQKAQCEKFADALSDGSMSVDGDLLVVSGS